MSAVFLITCSYNSRHPHTTSCTAWWPFVRVVFCPVVFCPGFNRRIACRSLKLYRPMVTYNLRNRHHNRHLTDHFSPESYSETRIGFLFYLIVPILFLLMCIVAICQRLVKRIYGYGYGYGLNRRTIINPRIMLHAPVVFE